MKMNYKSRIKLNILLWISNGNIFIAIRVLNSDKFLSTMCHIIHEPTRPTSYNWYMQT